jgi:hypothetical protein
VTDDDARQGAVDDRLLRGHTAAPEDGDLVRRDGDRLAVVGPSGEVEAEAGGAVVALRRGIRPALLQQKRRTYPGHGLAVRRAKGSGDAPDAFDILWPVWSHADDHTPAKSCSVRQRASQGGATRDAPPEAQRGTEVRYMGTLLPRSTCRGTRPWAISWASKEKEQPMRKATESGCHSLVMSCWTATSLPSRSARLCQDELP